MKTTTAYRLQRYFAGKGNPIKVVNNKSSEYRTGLLVVLPNGDLVLWYGDMTHELFRAISSAIREDGR